MFGNLKKKLKSWLGKKDEEETKEEKPVETSEVKKPDTLVVPIEEKKPESKEEKPIVKEKETEKVKEEIPKEETPVTKEHVTEEKPEKKEGFFSKLTKKITTKTIDQEAFNTIFEDLEMILLENNVALEVVDKIRENLEVNIIGKEIKRGETDKIILESLKNTINEVLIEPPNLIEKIKENEEPFIIVFFGINGSGKTTSISKLAHKLKQNNISCVLAAGDTFRAASIEQLEKHGNKLGIKVLKQDYGADPTAVAFDAKQYAKKNNIKAVLIDTAGRMYTKENLIKQMEKLIRVIQPDLKIFVGESITGNDATQQAKTFHEAVGIDGIILSKADIDEKAGTILSVSFVTGKPIYFLGVGQNYEDLQDFNKEIVLSNLGIN